MFKTLQSALFASFIALVVLTLIIFTALATPRIKTTTISQISDQLLKQLKLIQDDFSILLAQPAPGLSIQKKTLAVSKLAKGRVTVIANDGSVLGDSATPFAGLADLDNLAARREIKEAAALNRGRAVRHSATIGEELIYVAVPLTNKDQKQIGFLRLAVPTTSATELVLKTHKAVAAALFIAMIIAVLLSLLFSRSFAKPIIKLADISRQIAQGRFTQAIVHKSRFEVGKLEEAVEQMSQRLADTFQKLSAERGQVSAILSSMTEGVLAADQSKRIILANPIIAKMFGVIEPEILGKTVREGLRNNQIAGLIGEAIESGRVIEKEINIVIPVERVFIAHAGPIRNEATHLLGVVCVLHDITELRRLEKYRSEFVANVSHELKTPLTAIRNYVETLIAGAIDDRKHNREFLSKIDKHALNLSGLIDDILEISRLEAKKELTPFTEIDLGSIARRAIETISAKAKKKGIAIEKQCAKDRCLVRGGEEHVYQAVLNLLDNAVNYTDQGGIVRLFCEKKDGRIELTVSDTGIGMAKEQLPRIFERFYRIDKARSREVGGTGLGLAIVKHVMNIHHGAVLVESQLGQGSQFRLVFPA